tara:strand:+ start:183 stop:341 length:159 start_codon:yes stop_codon:yes gene_type:complete
MQTLEFPEQGFIQGGELAKRILLLSRKKTHLMEKLLKRISLLLMKNLLVLTL